jgi:hypothetical protein
VHIGRVLRFQGGSFAIPGSLGLFAVPTKLGTMHQKMAVASVLILVVLAGASIIAVQANTMNHNISPQSPSVSNLGGITNSTAGTNATAGTNLTTVTNSTIATNSTAGTNSTSPSSNGGSLLLSGNPAKTTGDDGSGVEIETEDGMNVTGDS